MGAFRLLLPGKRGSSGCCVVREERMGYGGPGWGEPRAVVDGPVLPGADGSLCAEAGEVRCQTTGWAGTTSHCLMMPFSITSHFRKEETIAS